MKKRSGLIRNSFKVFLHDVKSLFHALAALVVAVVLLVLPSLYAWYNVIGFWNPYDNTGNIDVCVVDEDKGGSSELVGELDIGEMVVEKLKTNNQLKWKFVDKKTADELLNSGEAYAAFVIPENFTESLLAMTNGVYESPTLTYITNEKAGPVSPKITDAGATTLDETINSTFVTTVSEIAVDAIDSAFKDEKSTEKKTKAVALKRIDEALGMIDDADKKLKESSKSLEHAAGKSQEAISNIDTAKQGLDTASKDAEGLSSDLANLQSELSAFSNESWPLASSAITAVSNASKDCANVSQTITSQASSANAFVSASQEQAKVALDQARGASDELRKMASGLPQGNPAKDKILATCKNIDNKCDSVESSLKSIQMSSSNIAASQEKIDQAAKDNDAAIQALTGAMQEATGTFFGKAAPSINSTIALASRAASAISSGIPAQKVLLDDLKVVLEEMKSALSNSKIAIDSTRDNLARLSTDLKDLRTDAASLLSADAVSDLIGVDTLDAKKIADFMGAPTGVKIEKMYSPNAYGASMAPLFMNLTFWIGAFMLIVIMRQEVYYPQIKRLTTSQCYLGRFWLFACMAVMQAIICCVGLIAIGIEAANTAALICAACMTSLAYLSIIYALSLTLQYVGKGICILLIFAQIPGAAGLYPVEMTSGFFQAIYPIFPFTYGIEAMREAICGFYGTVYIKDMIVLFAFFLIAMIVGMAVRPFMANVSRMVSLQVHKSGIYNGEKTMIPPRPFRFSQIVNMLVNKEEYRDSLESRYKTFAKWYPRIIRGSIVLGIVVPIGLVAIFALTPTEKVVILTVWLVFLAVLFVILVIVESLKNSLKRQLMLEGTSSDKILRLFGNRNEAYKAQDAGHDEVEDV